MGFFSADDVSDLHKHIRTTINRYVAERFADRELKLHLSKATLIDPRYKNYLQEKHEVEYTAARLEIIETGIQALRPKPGDAASTSTPDLIQPNPGR